jgi:peptide/nickel transport system substrate-binding protein
MRMAAALLPLLLAVVAGPTTGVWAQQGGELVVAIPQDVLTMDPLQQAARIDQLVLMNVFDNLVIRDDQMRIRPHLAESWSVTRDGTLWRFRLRRGVRFHNGEPFNAAAVKFTFDRLLSPTFLGQSRAVFAEMIKAVRVVDDYTVEIETNGVQPLLLPYLATTSGWAQIVPPQYIREQGETAFLQRPIGTGPYRFVERVKDERIVLTANPEYFLGSPRFERLVFRVIPNPATRVAALNSGEVDVVGDLSAEDRPAVEGRGVAMFAAVPSVRRVFVSMRTDAAPTGDRRVRQAVNYAVNVDELIRSLLGGLAKRMYSPVVNFEFGFTEKVRKYSYNPDVARRLLEQAGYRGKGPEVTFEAPSGRYVKDREVAQAIANSLERVGFKVRLQFVEWALYNQHIDRRTVGNMFLLGWGGGGTLDADATLTPLLTCYKQGGPNFRSFYCNPRVDQLIRRARSTTEVRERGRLYEEALRIITDDAPWLFLWSQEGAYGISRRVEWRPRPDEALWFFGAKPARR